MDFHIEWWQALFIGLWAAIALIGGLLGNYTSTVLIYATGIGIILGDIQTGVVMGAAGQAVWLGFGIGQGGTKPPDPMAPGIFGTVMCIAARHNDPNINPNMLMTLTEAGVYVSLSIPVGILLQLVGTGIYTLQAPMASFVKKAIDEEKYRKFKWLANTTLIFYFIYGFIFGLVVGFAAGPLSIAANQLPWWLNNGFQVVGGLLPALGFALILKVMLKKEHFGFVFIGYFLLLVFEAISAALGTSFSVLGLAMTALGLALIILSLGKISGLDKYLKTKKTKHTNQQEMGGEDGI